MNKKIFYFSIVFILIASLTVCNKKSAEEDKKIYFSSEETASRIKLRSILSFAETDTELILVGLSELGNDVKVVTFDLSGILKNEFKIKHTDEKSTIAAYVNDDAIRILSRTFITNELTLSSYDHTGNHLKDIVPDVKDDFFEGANLIVDDNGYIFIGLGVMSLNSQSFYGVFDESGKPVFDISNDNQYKTTAMIRLPSDKIAVLQSKQGSVNSIPVFRTVNVKDMKYDEEFEIESYDDTKRWSVFFLRGALEYDILRVEDDKVSGLNLKAGTSELLAEINANSSPYILFSNDSIFALEMSDQQNVNLIKYMKTNIPPDTDKKTLVLATPEETDFIKETVFNFNKESSEYRIEVKSYLNSDTVNYDDALNAFNIDLISGKSADIFHLDSVMPISNYIQKGLFADLYEYIDRDNEISRNNYVENLLKILETDGRLYTISSLFYIQTLVGKAADVGIQMGWTWEEFEEYVAQKPADAIPISANLEFFLSTLIFDYIDKENGTCNFETPEFYALLRSMDKYRPVNMDLSNDHEFADDYSEGRRLLMPYILFGFGHDSITTLQDYYFNAEITFKGFPVKDGSFGSTVTFLNRFAISALSEEKEGAFQYIKHLLMNNEYLKSNTGANYERGFPITIKALRKHADIFRYTEREMARTVNGVTTQISKPTDNDIQKIMALIESVSQESSHEYGEIINIIISESEKYFSGIQTAEAVAAIIQNRVSLYLSESAE